jgi:hypothetical protein
MTKSRIEYPTDLNDTEYAHIAPLVETTIAQALGD